MKLCRGFCMMRNDAKNCAAGTKLLFAVKLFGSGSGHRPPAYRENAIVRIMKRIRLMSVSADSALDTSVRSSSTSAKTGST